jgi:hypothetical protein
MFTAATSATKFASTYATTLAKEITAKMIALLLYCLQVMRLTSKIYLLKLRIR